MLPQLAHIAAEFTRYSQEGYTEVIAATLRQRWDDAKREFVRDLEIHFIKHDAETASFQRFFGQPPAFLRLVLDNVRNVKFQSPRQSTLELLIRDSDPDELPFGPICIYSLDENGYDGPGPFYCPCDSFNLAIIKP